MIPLLAAWTAGFVNDVKVMTMAAPAALLLLLNVSVRTTGPVPVMVGAKKTTPEAVAAGLPTNAGEPAIVMTSLPEAGIAAAGVMLMVTVTPAALARTSGRLNVGPVRMPFTISGNEPALDVLRRIEGVP